eukprot:2374-Heterococcus_DN1.PRE.2
MSLCTPIEYKRDKAQYVNERPEHSLLCCSIVLGHGTAHIVAMFSHLTSMPIKSGISCTLKWVRVMKWNHSVLNVSQRGIMYAFIDKEKDIIEVLKEPVNERDTSMAFDSELNPKQLHMEPSSFSQCSYRKP